MDFLFLPGFNYKKEYTKGFENVSLSQLPIEEFDWRLIRILNVILMQ